MLGEFSILVLLIVTQISKASLFASCFPPRNIWNQRYLIDSVFYIHYEAAPFFRTPNNRWQIGFLKSGQ